MINLTSVICRLFCRDSLVPEVSRGEIRAVQEEELRRMLRQAAGTRYGREHDFIRCPDYDSFARNTPLVEYPAIRPYVMDMVEGNADVLWPGKVTRFAQSSGTSDGKSKYIPITAEGLKGNHYMGGAAVINRYLRLNPRSKIFSGKGFILGGSFANELNLPRGVKVGDLSAHLIDRIPDAINFFRTPLKRIALIENWHDKLPLLVKDAPRHNVTNLSGVPSWFLTVIKEIMAARNVSELHDVWPNLEVFFHGGISFRPYREQYNALIDPQRMNYLETYNASEGFFAVQNTPDASEGMELLLNIGVFYEFIPLSELDSASPVALPAWEVEEGKTYALAITTINGLWRYLIGDTVRVTSVNPLKIEIAGRTKSFINAFGEELMVYNADKAIEKASALTGIKVLNYTAAPLFASEGKKACHQWVIEFENAPENTAEFARTLDEALRRENSDYQAKRSDDIFLAMPEIIPAPAGTFDRFLALSGKLGGQRKVPRLSNSRDNITKIIDLIQKTKS